MTLTPHTSSLDASIGRIARLLEERPAGAEELTRWRQRIRSELSAVRQLVVAQPVDSSDWLAARRAVVLRERNALLGRITRLRALAAAADVPGHLGAEASRLLADVRRHVQRLHDLVYDEVELELELGGSE